MCFGGLSALPVKKRMEECCLRAFFNAFEQMSNPVLDLDLKSARRWPSPHPTSRRELEFGMK